MTIDSPHFYFLVELAMGAVALLGLTAFWNVAFRAISPDLRKRISFTSLWATCFFISFFIYTCFRAYSIYLSYSSFSDKGFTRFIICYSLVASGVIALFYSWWTKKE